MEFSKPRISDCKKIYEDLDLEYPLEELRGAGAPSNEDVLRHLYYFLGHDGKKMYLVDAVKSVLPSIKAGWLRSNVDLAWDKTLEGRVQTLYKLFR
jgi:hypothetical protein